MVSLREKALKLSWVVRGGLALSVSLSTLCSRVATKPEYLKRAIIIIRAKINKKIVKNI
jgi:hypothetical protein